MTTKTTRNDPTPKTQPKPKGRVETPATARTPREQRYANRAMHSAPRAKVLTVRPGRVLLWPNGEVRGKAGYCVAHDDPFIEGYDGVLVAAPDGAVPDAIDHPVYQGKLKEAQRQAARDARAGKGKESPPRGAARPGRPGKRLEPEGEGEGEEPVVERVDEKGGEAGGDDDLPESER